jgi:hypothetical protein
VRSTAAQSLWDIAATTRVRSDRGLVQGDLDLPRPAHAGESWATATLSTVLYRRCYLGRSEDRFDAVTVDRRPAFAREDPVLGAALRQADGGRYCWSPDWRLETETDDGAVLVDQRGLHVQARREEYRSGRGGVEVRFPTARPFASPGFFLVCGTAGAAVAPDVMRWYLDVAAPAAPEVLRLIVTALDGLEIRYTFKILSNPADHPRPDAAVLYTSRRDVTAVHPVVLGLHDEQRAAFRPAIPRFSRRIRDGVGIAEDPPQSAVPVSFGQHRCRLVARGIVAAGPDAGAEQRYAAIRSSFDEAGISVDAPHLNPGSAEFDLPDGDDEGASWAA